MGVVNWVNSFYDAYFSALEGSSKQFFPFFVADQRVGVIPKFFVDVLKRFPATFVVNDADNDVDDGVDGRRRSRCIRT